MFVLVFVCLFVFATETHGGWWLRSDLGMSQGRRALPGAVERPRKAASFRLGVGGPLSAPLRCQPFCQRGGGQATQREKYNTEPCRPLTVLGTPPAGHWAACQGLATLRWKQSRQGTDRALDPKHAARPGSPLNSSNHPSIVVIVR